MIATRTQNLEPPPLQHDVRIEFLVRAPDGTPEHAPIFLSGNHPRLGQWRPDGLELMPLGDGEYHGRLDLPRGAVVEFKFTRGRWHTAERDVNGDEIPNRVLRADAGTLLLATIAAWPDLPDESAPYPSPLRLRRGVW